MLFCQFLQYPTHYFLRTSLYNHPLYTLDPKDTILGNAR